MEMTKQLYRTKIGIYYDILKFLKNNGSCIASNISRHVNTSHDQISKRLSSLIQSNYVEPVNPIHIHKSEKILTRYRITNNGILLIDQLESFDKLMQNLGGAFTV